MKKEFNIQTLEQFPVITQKNLIKNSKEKSSEWQIYKVALALIIGATIFTIGLIAILNKYCGPSCEWYDYNTHTWIKC